MRRITARIWLAGTAILCWMGKYGDTENPAQWNGWRVLAGGNHYAIPERIPAQDTR